jgi:hypothetical protein
VGRGLSAFIAPHPYIPLLELQLISAS